MAKKFKLTSTSVDISEANVTVYQIEALRDFGNVKKGDRGRFIQSEDNLSQEGNCWVYGDAKVYGKATVFGNAEVCGHAKVYDNARAYGCTKLDGDVEVNGNTQLYDIVKTLRSVKVIKNGDTEIVMLK